jgi:DNA-binding transcriptional MerR regulator
MNDPILLDLNDLCQEAGVTARTVRYYVQQGLLPTPGLGAGARYGGGHLARLRLIRRLQSEHLPLAEIRRRLEALDDDAVEALLEAPAAPPPGASDSAVDYVRGILAGGTSGPVARTTTAGGPGAAGGAASRTPLPAAERAQWERIALTPDVEVHVRRPLSREDNRRVDKLLETARGLFQAEGD